MDQTIKMKLPKHPREDANIFSILTFSYMLPTLIKGYFKDIHEQDVPKILDGHSASKLGDLLENSWGNEINSGRNSLWRALRRIFVYEFSILGSLLAIDDLVLKLLRPLALAQLLKYYSVNKQEISTNETYICAGVILGVSVVSSLISNFTVLTLQVLGMKIRVACCSLIYRKALILSKSAIASTAVGQITNLLSSDVARIDSAVCTAHGVWQVPIQIVLIVAIMYTMLGLNSTVGVVFMVLLVPIQVYLGERLSKLRLKTALLTDERVRLTNEIIYGMKVIKMYTWEKPFEELVLAKRRLEIGEIRKANYIRGCMKCIVYAPKFAIFITIITAILTGNNLTALYVFTISAFYDTLKQSLCLFFIRAIADVAEARVSINRIQSFLLYNNQEKVQRQGSNEIKLELENVTAKWVPNSSEATLKEISLKIHPGEHIALVGTVGSGKSSILEVFLNELRIDCGSVTVNGKISYSSQEPWLFSGNIQQNILFGSLMNEVRYKKVLKVCALEQDLQILPYGDQTLVGERGVVLSGGQKARVNLARAVYLEADIYLLDDPSSAVDTRVGLHIFNNCIKSFLSEKCVVFVTHQLHYLRKFERIYLIENGNISVSGTIMDILQHNSEFSKELECNGNNDAILADELKANVTHKREEEVFSESEEQVGSDIHRNCLFSCIKVGGWISFAFAIFWITISQVAIAVGEYSLAYWVNQKQNMDDNVQSDWFSFHAFLYGYSGIAAFTAIALVTQALVFFRFCTRVAEKLHTNMFDGIMHTSMLFFNLNTSGNILNRFSKDIGVIDEQIPMTAVEAIQISFRLIFAIVLISLCNYWLMIHSALLISGLYVLRVLYYPTNRQVKLFEANARGPVFGHLNDTLQGISTIRAFGAQEILKKEFDQHQNFHSSVWYLSLTCTRTLIFYIDILCITYMASVIFTLILIQEEHYGGNIGLAITQSIILLTSQQWGVLQSTELENSITSIERVLNYASLEPEDTKKLEEPHALWPQQGTIDFKSLCLKYSPKDPVILKQLSFSIRANEKIGVVGRTGAGKSSLIAALFQLVRTEGSITIDNINISEIPLYNLRSTLSIIPQEPVLFSGTLRKNLDQFNLYTDEELWRSLEDIELKSVISKLPLGLNCVISEGGANLSVGQRQLLCLARAILRENKILVLDEATANVDPYTDRLIQTTLRRKFEKCTVITVAHRLNTVMDCDRILVMQDGEVLEFDHPYTLLQKTEGMFYSMVHQTGYDNAKYLTEIAEENFKNIGTTAKTSAAI